MAKFKVGDKVRIVVGFYPTGYVFPCVRPSDHQIGMVGHVKSVDQDYPAGYLPDYKVEFEEGGFERIDEVHLELVPEVAVKAPEPQQYVVDSALALHAFEILERIEAKLTAIEERLAAHEARSNQSTGVVINVTGNVSMPAEMPAEMAAIAPEASAEPEAVGSIAYDDRPRPIMNPWLDMHSKAFILDNFKVGDKVEFTHGAANPGDPFVGVIDHFDVTDDTQFLAISYDRDLYRGTRWPDLSIRKVRKVIE